MKYTTVTALANDWLTEMGYKGKIPEEVIYRYIHNATELLIGSEWVTYRVGLLDVENFTAKMDPAFHSETLVACVSDKRQYVNRGVIKSYTQDLYGTDCEIEVSLKCPSCHKESCNCATPVLEIDIDQVYLDTHPYMKQINNSNMIGWAGVNDDGFPTVNCWDGFQIMQPKVSNELFWNSEYYLGVCNALGRNMPFGYSYQIEDGKFITDLKEGQVMISYLAYKKDPQGYLMVPNVVEAVEAVKAYITREWMWKEWMMSGNQSDRLRWLDAKNQAHEKIIQAQGKLELPSSQKWYRLLTERWTVPRDRYHYGD